MEKFHSPSLSPFPSLSLSHHERWKRKVQTKSPSNAIPGDVLKKLYGKQRETTSGKSEMEKSLSPHYLLTIHYWTRYTRFRIPIAKSFPRRCIHPSSPLLPLPFYRLPYPILSQTNKRPVHGHDTDLHSRSPIRIRALIRILEINRSPKGTAAARVRSSRVCLENKNASSKLVYPMPPPLFSPHPFHP